MLAVLRVTAAALGSLLAVAAFCDLQDVTAPMAPGGLLRPGGALVEIAAVLVAAALALLDRRRPTGPLTLAGALSLGLAALAPTATAGAAPQWRFAVSLGALTLILLAAIVDPGSPRVARPRRRRGAGRRRGVALGAGLLMLAISSPEASITVVEDWAGQPVGVTQVPGGWSRYATLGGRPQYDFTVVEDDGRRVLRLRSHDDHSTIVKEVAVDVHDTPVLEWSWKAIALPAGGDLRKRETSDLTGHVLVIWPRFPALMRSRLIGYVWDASAPVGTVETSRKTDRIVFFVLRSGSTEMHRWVTERRNVLDDYRTAFGEEPDNPRALALSIDSNDTRSSAESLIGSIAFRTPAAPRP